MDNHMGGLRFGPGGADFDESVLRLGKHTDVHAALGVDFPKSWVLFPMLTSVNFFMSPLKLFGIRHCMLQI